MDAVQIFYLVGSVLLFLAGAYKIYRLFKQG